MSCPICTGADVHHAALNFNTACDGAAGKALPATDRVIEYRLCTVCGHCFAPEMIAWPLEDFETLVYNADYALVDPEYVDARPRSLAERLLAGFGTFEDRHLDYGAGMGLLSELLSRRSLWHLGRVHGFELTSHTEGTHVFHH